MARSGTGRRASTGSPSSPKATRPSCVRVGLPGDPTTATAATSKPRSTGSIVASIYLPNGNPVGTEKFAYKLKWMERLAAHAAELLADERPTVLAGDYNVIPRPRRLFGAGDAA